MAQADPIRQPADAELGWTTEEDAADWAGPADIRLHPAAQTAVTRTLFAYHLLAATYGTLRWIVCRTGVHRRKGWH